MNRAWVLGPLTGAWLMGICLSGGAMAEDPPTKSVGLSGRLLSEMPLAPEFKETGDRRFRMRILTLEKGGVVALHDHKTRPSLEYVLSGTATEFAGGTTRVVKAGDVVPADHATEHWWRNDGDERVVILAVDIYLGE